MILNNLAFGFIGSIHWKENLFLFHLHTNKHFMEWSIGLIYFVQLKILKIYGTVHHSIWYHQILTRNNKVDKFYIHNSDKFKIELIWVLAPFKLHINDECNVNDRCVEYLKRNITSIQTHECFIQIFYWKKNIIFENTLLVIFLYHF